MKKIMLFVLVAVMAVCTTACSQAKSTNQGSDESSNTAAVSAEETSGETSESSNVSDTATVIKNVKIKTAVQEDSNKMAVFLTNNNKIIIDDLELKVNFYDSNNKIIDLGEDGHDMILPGATVVSQIDDVPDNYDHYDTKINVSLGINSSYENHAKNVDLSYNKGNDCVIVNIKNNDKVKIDEIEFIVLTYKDNKLIDVKYPQDVENLEPGDTDTEKIDTFEAYDRVEVYLNQAHTFE